MEINNSSDITEFNFKFQWNGCNLVDWETEPLVVAFTFQNSMDVLKAFEIQPAAQDFEGMEHSAFDPSYMPTIKAEIMRQLFRNNKVLLKPPRPRCPLVWKWSLRGEL